MVTADPRLSATMVKALKTIRDKGGTVYRFPGGFWTPDKVFVRGYNASPYFGTSTIEGLVKRGKLAYSTYQEGKSGRFPVEATLV